MHPSGSSAFGPVVTHVDVHDDLHEESFVCWPSVGLKDINKKNKDAAKPDLSCCTAETLLAGPADAREEARGR